MVKDQRAVLKEITTEIIHPYFKKWGFKKKRVHFIKTEGDITKIFTIFSSWYNTKRNISFTFELKIIKDDKELVDKRLSQLKGFRNDPWYEINKDTNVDNLKAEIASDITKYAKPFFDNWQSFLK